jgi:hypothetical protein
MLYFFYRHLPTDSAEEAYFFYRHLPTDSAEEAYLLGHRNVFPLGDKGW